MECSRKIYGGKMQEKFTVVNIYAMAIKVFETIGECGCAHDSFTYGALISELFRESKLDEARKLYEEMMDKGLAPCEVTWLIKACAYCKKAEYSAITRILER